jgi:hypothetical protein
MDTQCTKNQLNFQGLGTRKVQADFDGGQVSSDGGVLLLRELDSRLNVIDLFAECFTDYRDPELIEHSLAELLRQRIFGIALGYEDLNDHDDLMRDMLLAVSTGKQDVQGNHRHRASDKGKALASSSTLNRLELTPEDATQAQRYKKIVYHGDKLEAFFVTVFLNFFAEPPEEIILDFDATDDPLHGNQEGRFFHGYYDCYCYMPLYVTCGDHLLVAKLRKADIDASAGTVEILAMLVQRIRERFPHVRIILRGDSGFCREPTMAWCETNQVYYILGLAKNARLLTHIEAAQDAARIRHLLTGVATRVFTSFQYSTLDTWTISRRVIAKAECLNKGVNPRFIVTNLPQEYGDERALYEDVYCARGDMENRIKEQQLDLFADRTSAHTMRANQLRLWFSSLAYVLVSALRRIGLAGTRLAKATCGSIRLRLFKIGALITVSVRRFAIRLATACPYQDVFRAALRAIQAYPLRN